jgi:hypothetical protein
LRRSLAIEIVRERTRVLYRLSTASEPLIAAKHTRTGEKWRLPFAAFPSPSGPRYSPLLVLKARPSPPVEHTTSLHSSSNPGETCRRRNRRKETSPTASSLILASHRLHEWRAVVGQNSRRGGGASFSSSTTFSSACCFSEGRAALFRHPSRPLSILPPSRRRSLSPASSFNLDSNSSSSSRWCAAVVAH